MVVVDVTPAPGRAAERRDLVHALPLDGRRRVVRLLIAAPLVALGAGCVAVALQGRSSGWAALLSLAIPGLGTLVAGAWVAGTVLFAVGLACWAWWVLRGDARLPPLAVGASVGYAATGGRWYGLLAGTATGAAGIAISRAIATNRREGRYRRFEALRGPAPAVAGRAAGGAATGGEPPPPPALECTPELEAFHRWFLEFGRRPLEDWSGYDTGREDFDGALRYQTVLSAWAVWLAQQRLTPAYREAASACLGTFAERGRDHRLWSYWAAQSRRGAYRYDGDPFAVENVMYSGYIADVVSMYEAMSGDGRYDEPGAYSVSDGTREFVWDHGSIIERLALQHATSPLGSIPCMPGWNFPACQTFSLRAIGLADRVHGTDHGWAGERCLEAIERWFGHERGTTMARHNVFGVPSLWNLISGINGAAATAAFLAPALPDQARAGWERTVLPAVRPPDDEGRRFLDLSRIDEIDTSYGRNPGLAYSTVLLLARELGAEEADGIARAFATLLHLDAERPAPGSIVSNAIAFLALLGGRDVLAAEHARVPARQGGFELRSAPWPELVVLEATSSASGIDVLVGPGPAAGGPATLVFDGFAPGGSITVDGEPATAGSDGTVEVVVDSRTRRRLRIES